MSRILTALLCSLLVAGAALAQTRDMSASRRKLLRAWCRKVLAV